MRQGSPYLIFPGTCREALETYAIWFDGSVKNVQTFAQSPVPVAEEDSNRIFNSEFQAEGVSFMASDDLPDYATEQGSNFSFLVHFDDAADQTRIYAKMMEAGTAIMPLPDDIVESRFGMVRDRFGIQWMLSYQKPEQK